MPKKTVFVLIYYSHELVNFIEYPLFTALESYWRVKSFKFIRILQFFTFKSLLSCRSNFETFEPLKELF
jgi:hypothetical protein